MRVPSSSVRGPLTVLALTFALVACGGGSGGSSSSSSSSSSGGTTSSGGGDPAPAIDVSLSPSPDATGVARDTVLTATFGSDSGVNQVDADDFELRDRRGNPVAGALAFDAASRTATFTPAAPLDLLSTYTATVLDSVLTRGTASRAPVSASFTTREGIWKDQALIEHDADKTQWLAQELAADSDASGRVVAIWTQHLQPSAAMNNDLWANIYTPGAGWGTEALLETEDLGDVGRDIDVAMDAQGNAIAVWTQSDGVRVNIWFNRYDPNTGWTGATKLVDQNLSASSPRVGFDGAGNATVIWVQFDGVSLKRNVWQRRYATGSGWETATKLENSAAGDASSPHLAVDASGTAMAVWLKKNGAIDSVWYAAYDPVSGWTAPGLVEQDDAGFAADPKVAYAPDGLIHAIWSQLSDSGESSLTQDLFASRYSPGSGWSTPERIENLHTPVRVVDLKVGGDGEALAVWTQASRSSPFRKMNINRYTPGSGWGSPLPFTTLVSRAEHAAPSTVIDAEGNALVVWREDRDPGSGHFMRMASRFDARTRSWNILGDGTPPGHQNSSARHVLVPLPGNEVMLIWSEKQVLGLPNPRWDVFYRLLD